MYLIGIGPGKTASKEAATNSTLSTALQTGITEGENLINAKIANAGTNVNGWLVAWVWHIWNELSFTRRYC